MSASKIQYVSGNLLEQPVEAIVNPWNRNLIPWWLLVPHGVSGAIRKEAGTGPFKELAKKGIIPLGGATSTNAGRLPFKAIIHVAGIGLNWMASDTSIRNSTHSALKLAEELDIQTLAFPLIGSGVGGISPIHVKELITHAIVESDFSGLVSIVTFNRASKERNK